MAYLRDILVEEDLKQAITEGLVRTQRCPGFPFIIFNYTNTVQTNATWTDVTRKCRGLIVNARTEEIVARPFEKFFNYGEQNKLQHWSPDEPVRVTDKMDGSLGISYVDSDGRVRIATRGSFTSEQAEVGTSILEAKYPDWRPPEGFTVLFEIIYPSNRIVVDYGGTFDLVLLGAVEIETGFQFGPEYVPWPGPRTTVFSYQSLSEALSAPTRPGKEGLVVHFLKSDERVKIKQEDYLALHRIVTGLNEQVVWEHLKTHDDVEDLVKNLPEEFYDWTVGVMEDLTFKADAMADNVLHRYIGLVQLGLHHAHRKDFALAIKDDPAWMKPCLFKRLDGKDFSDLIWKQLKPRADATPNSRKETV